MAILNVNANKSTTAVKYLGSASSYDIKALYPNDWSGLTNSNFIVKLVSASASSSNSVSVDANGYSYGKSGNIANCSVSLAPQVTYTNGLLTVSGLSNSNSSGYNDKNGEGKGMALTDTNSISASIQVYMILGDIE